MTRANTSPLTQKCHYINGRWNHPKGKIFYSINPANALDVIAAFGNALPEEVDDAVHSAKAAQAAWARSYSQPQRGDIIRHFGELIGHNSSQSVDTLARLVTRECGKVFTEGKADVIEARHMVERMAAHDRSPTGSVLCSEITSKRMYEIDMPLGVIACITPWNFPFAIPQWQIMPALLKGNTVVLKPSEETPMCGHRIAEIAHKAGFPPGVLNVIQGDGETGWNLISHPGVDQVLFTGSYEVAKKIRLRRIEMDKLEPACETGGKNTILVFDDTNLDLAVEGTGTSILRTTGQRCVSCSRVLVQDSIYERFRDKLVEWVRSKKTGDGFDPSVFYGPVINQEGLNKILYYNELAEKEGARMLLRGEQLHGGIYDSGRFVTPQLYEMDASAQDSSRVLNEEVFGPHAALLRFKTLEEGINLANNTPYGLAMAYFTNNLHHVHELEERLETGMGYHNLPSIGAEVQGPFGGLKMSGTGKPTAEHMLKYVCHRVARTRNLNPDGFAMAQGMSNK